MTERIVMIGAGYWAQFQVEGWRDAGAPLRAIANRHLENAEALARRYGIPKCYGDVAAMLDAERPTLVDVVLPPVAQEQAVRSAIERGIPTICQKPFGVDLAQAEAMTRMAEAAGVPLVVHENFRFSPWFRELRRCINQGFFGRVHGIAFRLRPGDGQGPDAYLDRQPYFQQMPQFLVRETAVHFIDTFRFLMGEVRAVTARLRRLNPAIAGEDSGLLIFEFDDERTGLFDGNRLNEHPAENLRRTMGEMWLEGERGVMRLDGDARLWWKPHQGAERQHAYDDGVGRGVFGGASTALQAHVLAHLREGTPLENAAADYLANLRVQEAIYHSHASGARVALANFDPHNTSTRR
ncbi:Gfo/Idh/MocA family oxidoreductase [Ramlibacter ginsenosidimutans]|uniref:Gfo/Idh/MocA family oxidoreductase n=1 Tax=Ramlibacter ginsenosidimutans TaxID=502333 RepID=A0A934TQI6_9BURK|nr:Gfo/Idh/MocA family oxidoreductase [Ramlibacter ginsenosidimutans]MBK6004822.1 Gfo/Idh/MocA family oxidoreductase [Ramlibacter ginsenosidimutans]